MSCHVERILDDNVWHAYSAFVRRRPGGFAIASLVRPPSRDEQGAESFPARARALAELGEYGHHTHWTSPTHARPTGGDPALLVREQGAWLREQGLAPRFFCGGGWYMDYEVMAAVGELGYTDCTATAWTPAFIPQGDARISLDAPAWVRVRGERCVLELPTTHSAGRLVRSLGRRLPHVVHVHFHDYELLDSRRASLFAAALRLLSLRRRPSKLGELTADREVDWSVVCVS